MPGIDPVELTHQRLLRPLIDQRLSVVFYDLTTTLRAEGLSEQPGDLCRFGLAKEGIIARQCLLSVVQTAEVPVHRVRAANPSSAVAHGTDYTSALSRPVQARI